MARVLQGASLWPHLKAAVEPFVEPDVAVEEINRYRRDPFAHLDATEVWTDEQGDSWDGHILIPQIETGEIGPMRPMAHQVDFIEAWIDLDLLHENGELRMDNVLIEKARQMGMTWVLAYCVWWILTYHDVAGGYSNLNASEVDDGGEASTTDSFFGKVRFIQEHIPPRFRAPLRFRGGNAPLIRRRGSPSFIVGRGAVMNPGRGGTYRYWIVDEAARFPHGESAHAALDRACPNGRVYNSTPYGEANVYFRIRDEKPRNWTLVSYHWNEHPFYGYGKHIAAVAPDPMTGEAGYLSDQPNPEMQAAADSCELCKGTVAGLPWDPSNPLAHRYPGKLTAPWYDDAVIGLTNDQVASELDIDYAGSLPARVYPEFDDRVHVVDHIPYQDKVDLQLAFDYGLDTTAVAILQEGPTEIVQIGELEMADSTPDEVVRALLVKMAEIGVPQRMLAPHVLDNMQAVGDPSGDYRELGTGKSVATMYAQNHIHISSPSKPWSVAKTIVTTKRILQGRPKRYRVSAATCPQTIRHWKLNQWPTDKDGNRKIGETRTLDNQHNHMMRALAYWFTYHYPAPEIEDELDQALALARLRQREGVFTEARYGMRY